MPPKSRRRRSPGWRKTPEGRLGDAVHAWLDTFVTQVKILVYPHGWHEEEEELTGVKHAPALKAEPGDTIRLVMIKAGRPAYYTLTAMTHEELKLFREIVTMALDMAEPIVIERDRKAQDAFDQGDDSFARIYRQVPRLIVRERNVRADSEGVHDGPEGDADGAGGERDSSGGLRGVGSELANGQPEDGRAQDDEPTPH